MALQAGRHPLGISQGRIILHTYRDGLAAQAGHDLVLEVARWSGEITVADGRVAGDAAASDPVAGDLVASDPVPEGLEVRVDLGSLTVREGTGGLKPLTDKDRRDIAHNARKELAADRYPEATFTASRIVPGENGGMIEGTLTLHGTSRPLRLEITRTGPDKYRANTSIVQSAYGIKPYSAFLGALRLRDAVDVEADIDLSTPTATSPLGPLRTVLRTMDDEVQLRK
jgi:hypothetical protein